MDIDQQNKCKDRDAVSPKQLIFISYFQNPKIMEIL